MANMGDIYAATPKRDPYSSKADNGSVVVVAGSWKFHGAPVLASTAAYSVLAALRSGIGYATLFVPKGILDPVRNLSPDIIARPLTGNSLEPDDIPTITGKMARSQCLVIGPGLGREKMTMNAVRMLLGHAKSNGMKVVVDADAIYALAGYRKELGSDFIITPNMKEFGLFCKKDISERDLSLRVEAAMNVSRSLNAIVVLKGHDSVIANGKIAKVSRAKSSALAVMGTGDVLSGIIGGYAALNKDAFAAAVAGVHLHTLIGDMLYKEKGNHILASDVVGGIPRLLSKSG